jgi:hypothetical protein
VEISCRFTGISALFGYFLWTCIFFKNKLVEQISTWTKYRFLKNVTVLDRNQAEQEELMVGSLITWFRYIIQNKD